MNNNIMISAVSCRDVRKSFGAGDAAVEVLRGVDFEAVQGKLTFLVGPSGCGKTTLISVIAGLLDRSGGKVELFGQDLEELAVPEGAGPGLGQPRVDRAEHAGQAQRLERGGEPGRAPGGGHCCSPPNASGPRSQAGTAMPGSGSWTPSCSVPAARMPLTVR